MILLVLLVQSVVPLPPFWPTTGAGWITLVIAIAGAFYMIYDRIIAKGKRDAELNGLGVRVSKTEVSLERVDQRALDQGQELRDVSGQVGIMREEFGEYRRAIKELTDAVRDSNDKTHQLIGNVRVDIARTEERIGMIADLKDVVRDAISQIRR